MAFNTNTSNLLIDWGVIAKETYYDHRTQEYKRKVKYEDLFGNPTPSLALNTQKHKEDEKMETLYEFTKSTVETEVFYGKKLAEDSSGNWIMEVKGTGQVLQVNPALVKEVLPYTVGLRFTKNGAIYHYKAKAGEVELGYYLANNIDDKFVIVEVVELDTKSKKATKDIPDFLLKKL